MTLLRTITCSMLAVLLVWAIPGRAQDRPIGYWRSHFTYSSARSMAQGDGKLFAAGDISFFSLDLGSKDMKAYSKIDGMADVQPARIGYDEKTSTVIVAYQSGSIDLLRDGQFYNIPDFKNKVFSGTKSIYDIATFDGEAFVSTSAGILVLNLDKQEVKETYNLSTSSRVVTPYGFLIRGSRYYAVTDNGLYYIERNSGRILDPGAWTLVAGGKPLRYLTGSAASIYVARTDSIFRIDNDVARFVYKSPRTINHIDTSADGVWVSSFQNGAGRVTRITTAGQPLDSFISGNPQQVLQQGQDIYIADQYSGLLQRTPNGATIPHIPEGPAFFSSFGIHADDRVAVVAHGGYTDGFLGTNNYTGFSVYNSDKWTIRNVYNTKLLGDTMIDFVRVAKNPVTRDVWLGTMNKGALILRQNGDLSVFGGNDGLEQDPNNHSSTPANSLASDGDGNMWITQNRCTDELAAVSTKGDVYHFSINPDNDNRIIPHVAADVLVDNSNHIWFRSPYGPPGVVVLDHKNTLANAGDDQVRLFTNSDGIPGILVTSLVKDRNGAIWIGTSDGIAIMSCPDDAFRTGCKPTTPIVQYDQFAGKLFQGEVINAMAVDGANRKWIGTNNGLWLISPDGDKIIYRFTADNSPMPYNLVRSLDIDPTTGDVYVGTDYGLVSYRSTATEGSEEHTNVVVFPNPVPSGYPGIVAIKGLVEDADVRITDIAGQLVFRTKALGGQAIWNGLDYTGHRPQTGVYLIFSSNKDGSQTFAGKVVFVN